MGFVEKHKAFIITSLLMGIVVLGLYNIHMFNKKQEQAEIMMEIPEEFLMDEEEEVPEEEVEQEERKVIESKRTHSAYNEDFEDPDDFEERMKSLTESEDNAEEKAAEDLAQGEVVIDKDIVEEEKKEKPKLEEKETNNRNSSLSYSLKGRDPVDLPNPVYTCNGSGRVVVKIEVSKNGYVTHTKVDKKRSNTKNECLFDNALLYARKALFSRASLEKQAGSITYYFNYKH